MSATYTTALAHWRENYQTQKLKKHRGCAHAATCAADYGSPMDSGADTTQGETPEAPELTRTTRDHSELRASLEGWLQTKLPGAAVGDLTVPGNGMSSETVLFDVTAPSGDNGESETLELVARLEPDDSAVPVFPSYDLQAQFDVIRLVSSHTAAPVPKLRWIETDESVIGGAFIVMNRITGKVPPDVMPYTIESFLLDANVNERQRLEDLSVEVLAEIHKTPISGDDARFLEYSQEGDTALRRHFAHWVQYRDWVMDGRDVPLLTEAYQWLEDNWPEGADARPPMLSWGDARIGNVMYDDFEPVAVLDWEMAGIAPPEVDLGWMSYLHTFFQDITEDLGMPGIPGYLDAERVRSTYSNATGAKIDDLHWFRTYAAARHGAIMLRIVDRQVHFGEAEAPEDLEEAIIHRETLRKMIGQ